MNLNSQKKKSQRDLKHKITPPNRGRVLIYIQNIIKKYYEDIETKVGQTSLLKVNYTQPLDKINPEKVNVHWFG